MNCHFLFTVSSFDHWMLRFVHERGTRTAVFNLALMAGISIGPLIAGQLIQRYDWRICSYAMAAALVINLILTFFFMPETAYTRATPVTFDSVGGQVVSGDNKDIKLEERLEHQGHEQDSNESVGHGSPQIPRKSFWSELAFYSGYYHPVSFWKTLLNPLRMFRSPIVLWTSLVYMTAIVWIVMLTIGASQIFSAPPYNFGISAVGNTFLSSFIASIVGSIVAYPLIDGASRLMAKKNGGIFGRISALTVNPLTLLTR